MNVTNASSKRMHIQTDLSNVFIKKFDIDDIDTSYITYTRTGYHHSYQYDNGNIFSYMAYKTKSGWEPDCPQFIKNLVDLSWNYFLEIDPNARLTGTDRVIFNLSQNDKSMRGQEIHQDFYSFDGIWSALVHVKGTDGDTKFYNNMMQKKLIKSVPFVAGQIIIFPACYAHTGSLPKDDNPRYFINSLFRVNTILNQKVESVLYKSREHMA